MKRISTILILLLLLSTIAPYGVLAENSNDNQKDKSEEQVSVENDTNEQSNESESNESNGDEGILAEQEDSEDNIEMDNSEENNQNNSVEENEQDQNMSDDVNGENEESQDDQNPSDLETEEDVDVEEENDLETEEDIDVEEENDLETEKDTDIEEENSIKEGEQEDSIVTFSLPAQKNTSRLGHIRSSNVNIYKDLNNLSSSFKAGEKLTHAVYYIKSQAKVNEAIYYLISTSPSKVKGTIGWVKASDLSTHPHVGVDKKAKTLYFTGKGKAFTKAWGGNKDVVHKNMSKFRGQEFKIHLTEKVGKNTWYRGSFKGETIWLHSSYLTSTAPIVQSKTSQLGHLRGGAKIYKKIGDSTSIANSNTYGNAVYYIKSQAKRNNDTYYLISTSPSSTKGVVGWVNSKELSTHSHVGVDKKAKTLYFTGKGKAFTKAWGGNKDLVHKDMAKFKGQEFKVHLTEKVGKNTWYRGSFNGKTIWLHSSYVTTPKESKTSKLGHMRADRKIYKSLGDESSVIDGNKYANAVYYIKKQAKINDQLYYLISKSPSSKKGVIGWVKSSDLSTNAHVGIDKKAKIHFIKGTGSAFSKAWGGKKDIEYKDLLKYQNQEFKVHLTEKVGKNTWYRGKLNGKTVWLHSSYLNKTNTIYTDLGITFKKALDIQMTRSPQTDKKEKKKAYVHNSVVDIIQTAVINTNNVRLRPAANFSKKEKYKVKKGTKVTFKREVKGAMHAGSNKWYEIKYGSKTKNGILYVHSSLININAKTAKTNAGNVNVRKSSSLNSHVYKTVSKGTELNVLKEGKTWHEVNINDLDMWINPIKNEVSYHLNPSNNDQYQHLLLTSSVGVSTKELNKTLADKGVLKGLGQAFIKGGKRYSVNEIYLISHASLETGNGSSALARGIEVGKNKKGQLILVNSKNRKKLTSIKKVYNMFGIGAYDASAKESGAKKAYAEGWDTKEKAIIGGAKFIGQKYIHNWAKQNTIYKMRWNFNTNPPKDDFVRQYATDIGWASKQVNIIKKLYNKISNHNLHFDVPRFK